MKQPGDGQDLHPDTWLRGFPGVAVVKNLPANAGDARDTGSIPGSGRFPGEGFWLLDEI